VRPVGAESHATFHPSSKTNPQEKHHEEDRNRQSPEAQDHRDRAVSGMAVLAVIGGASR
jgi:hypothetical protein